MSGLEKIVGRISEESRQKADAILAEAKAKADGILKDNEKRVSEECGRIAKKAESQAQGIAERSKASAELRSKQILLAGRQEIMSQTIAMARARLDKMSDSEYTEVLLKLFKKHIPGQDAVLKLGERDLSRLSAGTLESMKAAASAAGVKLNVSGQPAAIRDGFVLDYGGIEENCTFDALFEQNVEELQDKVKAILFE